MIDLTNKKGIIVLAGRRDHRFLKAICNFFIENKIQIGFAYDDVTIEPFLKTFNPFFMRLCDFQCDVSLTKYFYYLSEHDYIDFIINDICYLDDFVYTGRCLDMERDIFNKAITLNGFPFIQFLSMAQPLFKYGGTYLGFTHYSARRWVPNYHLVSIIKSSLESIVRYVACEVSLQGIRVNLISCNSIISAFDKSKPCEMHGQKISTNKPSELQDVLNAIAYLISDLSKNISGEILNVDGGYNTLFNPKPVPEKYNNE